MSMVSDKDIPYHMCFDTLANTLRIQLINALGSGPKSVEELVKETKAEQSRVSHSLKMLKTCNYVEIEKKGKQHIYSLKPGAIQEIAIEPKRPLALGLIDKHVEHFCHNECKKMELMSK
ncbi:MAG: metalloregulator ArsR/SmtB family transcription factor [Candidatus Diapherotrites archaeon]|nr:metalloregulator ArsR/SmtB family transcription factor [Candidatus Diapherotrites archaeon]